MEHSTDLRESAEMHREIFRAIRARNPVEARQLMEKHLCMARDAQMLERHTERKPSPIRAENICALRRAFTPVEWYSRLTHLSVTRCT